MRTWTFRYTDASRPLRPPLVDVRRAEGPGPHPSVILVHGGGFVAGSRRMRAMATLLQALPAAGYTTLSFDYRLAFRGGRLDDAVDDAVAVEEWWRERAPRFDCDPHDVSLIGLSAGGAIAAIAAPRMGPLRRLASFYGLADFLDVSFRPRRVITSMLLRTRDRQHWHDRSPCRSLDLPVPVGLFHGLRDGIVDVRHSTALAAWRRERGLPVTLHLYDDAGHGFMRHPERAVARHAVTDLIDFLALESTP